MTKEEAIEVYNGLINTKIKEAFEFFAPELAESGNGWFIKELQGFLESYGADYFGNGEWQKFNDWLEKQKEPIDPFDTKLFQDGVKEGRRLEREDIMKERQPAEWSEEDENNLELVIDCIYKFYPDPVMKYKLKEWLKSLRPHWKPSEEQMDALRLAIPIVNNCISGMVDHAEILESLYDQLNKIR